MNEYGWSLVGNRGSSRFSIRMIRKEQRREEVIFENLKR